METSAKNTFTASSRAEWRQWLAAHFETAGEVWFVFPSKASGEPCITYNDAVEEALCFGWIDGQTGTLDCAHMLRRFTPRRKGGPYSRPNIERLIWLDGQGLIHPEVRPSVLPVIDEPYRFPKDIVAALREEPEAWAFYERCSEPYKRIRVAYVDAARKRPAEFQKRLNNLIEKSRAGKLIMGYGGVEKYYTVNR